MSKQLKICAFLLFGVLWFALDTESFADRKDMTVLHAVSLGRAGGLDIGAVIYCDGGRSSDFRRVLVRFSAGHGRVVRDTAKRFAGIGDTRSLVVKRIDLGTKGRYQLFTSAEMGGVSTRIYDYDGVLVREVYVGPPGRVRVVPITTTKGTCELVEMWPRIDFNDTSGLGVGVLSKHGYVSRRLHWDGSSFVPNRSGPTRIASQPARRGVRSIGRSQHL